MHPLHTTEEMDIYSFESFNGDVYKLEKRQLCQSTEKRFLVFVKSEKRFMLQKMFSDDPAGFRKAKQYFLELLPFGKD